MSQISASGSTADTPTRAAFGWVDDGAALALAGLLAIVAAAAGWRGADMPNYLFRAELYKRAGFTLWNVAWYAGHHTPGYSVILPPLLALANPAVVGLIAATVAAAAFSRLLRIMPGVTRRRRVLASLVFAASTTTNLAVGRLAFALGLAIALLAALAGARGHLIWAAVLSPCAALASPVAAVFLAVGWVAWGLQQRAWRPFALTAAALAPLGVLAVFFPEGGTFPFKWAGLAMSLGLCAIGYVALPREATVVRTGIVLYALGCLATFVVPNPLGANITRLGIYVGAPLLAACGRINRRVLLPVLAILVFWQWSPAVDAMLRSERDPSTSEAYYRDVVGYLQQRTPTVGRIEIPFTQRHFETTYVAAAVPLARGWERQLDMKDNAIFYEPTLDTATYHQWLLDKGVDLVALPDAQLDASARNEAAVIRSRPPYLVPVWQDAHWTVYEVLGSVGLVSGPARLVSQGPDSITIEAEGPGDVVVREHWMAYWTIDGPACVTRSEVDDWVHVQVHAAGRLVLHPVLTGERVRCADTP